MSPLLLLLSIGLIGLVLVLPKRLAIVPLLVAACHTSQVPVLGEFTPVRLVILVGLTRAVLSGSFQLSLRNPLDALMIVWALVALVSSVGHNSANGSPFVYRAGLVLNILGTYLYARAYLSEGRVLEDLARGLVIVMVPFAFLMTVEKFTGKNPYRALGARLETSLVREGSTRAKGPFSTPILAGTAGASVIPLMLPFFRRQRRFAMVGVASGMIAVFCSASSGPILTVLIGVGAVCLWRWRAHMKPILYCSAGVLLVLDLIKERPIWYLMALPDIVGGSTGWHRAKLIDAAIEYVGDWWLFGTDRTVHWMPYGLPSVPGHCDLTNYYIHFGVIGGLALLICLVLIIAVTMRIVFVAYRSMGDAQTSDRFVLWCVGSALFAHAVTFMSISYFDQMFVFFYVLVGAVPGLVYGYEMSGDEELDPDASLFEVANETADYGPPGHWNHAERNIL